MAGARIKAQKTEMQGWKFSAKAGEQKSRYACFYEDDWRNWRTRAPKFGSTCPIDGTMELVELEMTLEAGHKVHVDLVYESRSSEATYPGRDPGTVKRYDMELLENEEHLLTHERYKDISDGERRALYNISNGDLQKPNGGNWADDVSSEAGLNALEKLMKGQTHFKTPSLIWIERFSTKSLSDIDTEKFGEIMAPPGGAPGPGSERNYRYNGATGRNSEDGKSWDVERRWQLSEKGKWSDIYDPEWTAEGGGGGGGGGGGEEEGED